MFYDNYWRGGLFMNNNVKIFFPEDKREEYARND